MWVYYFFANHESTNKKGCEYKLFTVCNMLIILWLLSDYKVANSMWYVFQV